MYKFDLVIFDCDGVLVDSERIANTVLAEMLNELGLSLTLEDMFNTFMGNSMKRCLEIIEEMLLSPVPDNFLAEYHQRTAQVFRTSLKPINGIHDVIKNFELPYCVASSGEHEKMQITLGTTGLLPYFSGKIFSVTEVERGKPYPDIFLYAAKKMGFSPEKCLVVEDSPTGVKAGVAAGMTVFGYASLMKPQRLLENGASIVFDDMKKLPELLVIE
jgi:HAD superfamily hydrolase (TIGR01509 family)